ncbi:hypothetical protein [Pseudanabaena sp. ABRG5-3]|uniref:hypothetical protein n=1 Tax=Pseudanabaena sp. ABRG5-3 TaxID=685565 RepID=UPI000DC705D1|nr:hypothetical protein [Pseudanabaena sp. ABRG5-3]BBC27237.1 hypothetical protein ABRG53_g011 [Pseudanabaena sp. ABRG5-3]
MAKPTSKQSVEPIVENKPDFSESVDAALLNLEDTIADQILDSVDWHKVKQALLKKAPAKLFKWFQAQLLPTDGSPMITNEIEAMAISEGDSNA